MDVSTALAAIISHLTDVIAHHATGAAAGEAQAIHQMRVALRRLRSAIVVFRRAADCPGLQHAAAGLKASAAVLGEARDWDVFLAETVPPVASAFPEDPRVAGLITAAGRRRRDAHAALRAHLAEPGFRRLLLSLAALPLLRPWTGQDDPDHDPERAELLALPVADYATRRLARMRDRLLAETEAIETLSPPAMHEVRKRCKKLRYACEFFEDLYPSKPARRFTRRLARLQDDLGTLNDAAAAASLTGRLGGGAARAFGVGVVQGFVAAHAARARGDLARRREAWRRQPAFWS
jgi:CHAD domain-containing protein